jgi:hypothetical protein
LLRDGAVARNTGFVKLLGLLLGVVCAGVAAEGRGAAHARAIREAGLDPDACYRVRDLSFQREDLRFYFNEGSLIFSKAVDGKRFAAVFTADVPGGDAEVLVFPPHRSERLALATFTKSPNLNEHFTAAVFLFTDNTAEELLAEIQKNPRPVPEIGTGLAQKYNDTVRNFAQSYEVRLVQERFSPSDHGLFYAAVNGKRLGTFDLLYNPRQRDSITIGQIAFRDNRQYFDVWSTFAARSARTGRRQTPPRAFNTDRVRIEATFQPDLAVQARTRIELTANSDRESALAFELSRRMRVTEATLDGVPVEVFARESLRANLARGENDLFLLVLPSPLVQGRKYTLEFAHEGNVVSPAGNGVYFVGARTNWYPNQEAEFARYELVFHHPRTFNLVATGELAQESVSGETRTAVHRPSSPIRFAAFNLGEYRKVRSERAGITVEVYANQKVEAALQPRPRDVILVPPPRPPYSRSAPPRQDILTIPVPAAMPDPSGRLADLNAEIGAALDFMVQHFGPPPVKTLAVSPIPGVFGQGFPGLLYLSTLAYLNPADRPPGWQNESSRTFFSELLHAHEAAHQWWGNLVTSATYRDDWVMEALANYSALLVLEKRKGRRALDAVLDEYRRNLLPVDSFGPIVWGTRLISSQTPGAWRAITYEKGSWILHMLRARLGDAPFLRMLGELAKRKRFQPLTTDEFRLLAAEFLPPGSEDPKLEMFFEQWVYSTGIPALKLEYKVSGKAPKVRLRGTIIQSEAGEDFSAYVPVEIQLPGRRTVLHRVRTSSEPVEFTVDLKAVPVKVALAPNNEVLTRK